MSLPILPLLAAGGGAIADLANGVGKLMSLAPKKPPEMQEDSKV